MTISMPIGKAPSFTEMAKIKDGMILGKFLPELQEYTEKMEKALFNRVFSSLDDKSLTPEQALYAWMELKTYKQLVRRVEQQVRIGSAVGARTMANTPRAQLPI